MDQETIITGEVRFEDQATPFRNATLRVYLENVSLAGADSQVAGFYERENISLPPSGTLPFEIRVSHLDARESFAIRAHVDVDGNGSVSRDDFVSMQSYPVATFGYPLQVSVLVRQVK